MTVYNRFLEVKNETLQNHHKSDKRWVQFSHPFWVLTLFH